MIPVPKSAKYVIWVQKQAEVSWVWRKQKLYDIVSVPVLDSYHFKKEWKWRSKQIKRNPYRQGCGAVRGGYRGGGAGAPPTATSPEPLHCPQFQSQGTKKGLTVKGQSKFWHLFLFTRIVEQSPTVGAETCFKFLYAAKLNYDFCQVGPIDEKHVFFKNILSLPHSSFNKWIPRFKNKG